MWLRRLVAGTLIGTSFIMLAIVGYGMGMTKESAGDSVLNPDGTTTLLGSNGTTTSAKSSKSSSSSSSSSSSKSGSSSNSNRGSTGTGSSSGGSSTGGGSTGGSTSTGNGSSTGGNTSGGSSSGGSSTGGGTSQPVPEVTLTISPDTITAGSSSTIGWTSTNSPSSCTASGSWSGSKAASGSQSTGAIGSAGTYTYTLSCTNSGGTASASISLKVNAAVSYCGGLANCRGRSDLAAHASSGNCWAYTSYNRPGSYPSVFSLNALSSSGHGTKGKSGFYSKCGTDFTSCLNGSGGCGSSHSHSSSEMSKASYVSQSLVGYYDSNKP